MDRDLQDYINELVGHALYYIGQMEYADRLMAMQTAPASEHEFAMLKKQEFRKQLDMVYECYKYAQGYHRE